MKWYEEGVKLSQYPPTLNLEPGTRVIEILGEPKEIELPSFEDKKKLISKLVFPVKYEEMTYSWFVTKTYLKEKDGTQKETLFAQLARIAEANNGLTGAVIKMEIIGSGKRRFYKLELK